MDHADDVYVMRSARDERGQAAAEYLGVLVVVALIVGIVTTSDIPDRITAAIKSMVCRIADCEESVAQEMTPDADADGVTDAEELELGTDPTSANTDDNGAPDAAEIDGGTDPRTWDVPRPEPVPITLGPASDDGDDGGGGGVAGIIHGGLDACGLVPGLGELCDLGNAGIYALEGNYADAALSGAAAIPIGGWGAAAAKGAKYADEAVDAARRGDDVAEGAAKSGDAAASGPRVTEEGSELARVSELARRYRLDESTYTEHILIRHGPTSTVPDTSKFLRGFDIRSGIDNALSNADAVIKPNTRGRPGYIFEYTYPYQIGVTPQGAPLRTLKVVLDPTGKVKTAFPIR